MSLRGKLATNVTLAANGSGTYLLTADSFGQRVSALLDCYQRWKIMKLIIKPIFANSTVVSAYAVSDDPSIVLPTTSSQQGFIISVRTSRTFDPGVGSESADLQWNPIDPKTWYYTTVEGVGGDPRLTSPGNFLISSGTTSGTFGVIIYYSIEAEGAKNPTFA